MKFLESKHKGDLESLLSDTVYEDMYEARDHVDNFLKNIGKYNQGFFNLVEDQYNDLI
ncbi:hypothetical protein [Candidatus Mesenet endosymbiont of Agriotes lineatus]|uniref:hypothetical protein n=1 Tax=Candidatus Mesenet endosymbiont of Agriotes lineatus TaxID=3077948 RepID=UPI0030D2E12C